jgi:shikimate dehydrogenase
MSADPLSKSFVLVGHPVGHSLSPAIHEAAYDALRRTGHRYAAVDCPDEASVRAVFDSLRRGDLAGANVTVPWKRLALELADEVDPSARETGAANVLRPVGEGVGRRLVAHNTDVPALAEELSRGAPGARRATVIGSGGAALAAVVACRQMGATEITVVARKWRGARTEGWLGAAALALRGATPVAWPSEDQPSNDFRRAVLESDVIVQSTSDGMHGATDGTRVRDLVPWAEVPRTVFAYDVVYNPEVTPFVAAARAVGLRSESGLGMLVGQAVLALALWLGERPPSEPLRAAAERALAVKTRQKIRQ